MRFYLIASCSNGQRFSPLARIPEPQLSGLVGVTAAESFSGRSKSFIDRKLLPPAQN